MQELLQAVLDSPVARQPGAVSVVASQAAAEFSPWSSEEL